jgi:DNA polymerase
MKAQAVTNRSAALQALHRKAEQAGGQVFGEGDSAARLMLVGEAPGKSEVEAHRPFVGQAGLVLSRMLDELAILRHQIWITNTVKIRPVAPGVVGEVNRAPTASEVAAFGEILEDEIGIIRPRVILCLGAVAASALIHPNFRIVSERGRWFPGPGDTRLMATYHPAYLLRRRGPAYEAARDEMLSDLSRAWAEALGE